MTQLATIIERLTEVVEQETVQLRQRTSIDLKSFNDRKSQGLLELTRALRQVDEAAGIDQAVLRRLADLRLKLVRNQAALQLHLEAVREVSNSVCAAIRHAESDGTYSPSIRNRGQQPWCD